jgi:hypothetical protein
VAPAKPASAVQIANLQPEMLAPWGGEPGLLRGSSANSGADATLHVTYRDGKLTPPPGIIRLPENKRIKIRVTSDKRETITVEGYPDTTAVVDEDTPDHVAFGTIRPGTFRVTLQPDDILLTVLKVGGNQPALG